jgi:hypothetical protein
MKDLPIVAGVVVPALHLRNRPKPMERSRGGAFAIARNDVSSQQLRLKLSRTIFLF